jgi:hypothetical protein
MSLILQILRSLGAIVLALAVAFGLIIAVEAFAAAVHPVPPGVDLNDMEQCKAYVATYPAWVLAVAALLWALTVFICSWLATRLGTRRRSFHGFVVGGILLALAGFNMCLLPYPLWFEVLNVVAFPIATFAGARLGRRPKRMRAERRPQAG